MLDLSVNKINNKSRIFNYFLIGALIEGIICSILTVLIPQDPTNTLFGGLSLSRFFILLFLFFIMGGVITAFFKTKHILQFIEKFSHSDLALYFLTGIGVFSSLLLWITIWIPSDYLGIYGAMFFRLEPTIIWLELIIIQLYIFIKIAISPFVLDFSQFQKIGKTFGMIFIPFCGIWIFITTTKIGLLQNLPFWNVPGIPTSSFQFFSIIFLILLVSILRSLPTKGKSFYWVGSLKYIIPIMLYLGAVIAWGSTPMPKHFFSLEPSRPNLQPYPFSDARFHDIGAIAIIKGQGINFHESTDKPLYMVFLAGLHLIAGNNYVLLPWLQILFLGFIPVILFLLGKKFHGNLFGLILAFLIIFQQVNAIILSSSIASVNPQLLMTEEITLLGIVLVTYLAFLWMESPKPRLVFFLGAILGALSLIRINPIVIFPIIIILIVIRLHKSSNNLLRKQIFLFSLGFFMVFTPWLITGVSPEGKPWFFIKIMSVIDARYHPGAESPILPTNSPGSQIIPTSQPSTSRPSTSQPSTPRPTTPRPTTPRPATPHPATPNSPLSTPLPGGIDDQNAIDLANPKKIGMMVFNHFLHNFTTSFLALPDYIEFKNISDLSQREYWQDVSNWKGDFPPIQNILIILNFALVTFGLVESWKRYQWAGLIPLVIFFAYDFSLSIAMNSGSRYIAPINWIIFFYYGLGLMLVWNGLLNFFSLRPIKKWARISNFDVDNTSYPPSSLLSSVIMVTLFAAIIPFTNLVIPQFYKPTPEDMVLTNTIIRGIPPKQLSKGQIFYPYYTKDRQRIIFDFLTEKGRRVFTFERKYLLEKSTFLESDIPTILYYEKIKNKNTIVAIYLLKNNKPELIWQKK